MSSNLMLGHVLGVIHGIDQIVDALDKIIGETERLMNENKSLRATLDDVVIYETDKKQKSSEPPPVAGDKK